MLANRTQPLGAQPAQKEVYVVSSTVQERATYSRILTQQRFTRQREAWSREVDGRSSERVETENTSDSDGVSCLLLLPTSGSRCLKA